MPGLDRELVRRVGRRRRRGRGRCRRWRGSRAGRPRRLVRLARGHRGRRAAFGGLLHRIFDELRERDVGVVVGGRGQIDLRREVGVPREVNDERGHRRAMLELALPRGHADLAARDQHVRALGLRDHVNLEVGVDDRRLDHLGLALGAGGHHRGALRRTRSEPVAVLRLVGLAGEHRDHHDDPDHEQRHADREHAAVRPQRHRRIAVTRELRGVRYLARGRLGPRVTDRRTARVPVTRARDAKARRKLGTGQQRRRCGAAARMGAGRGHLVAGRRRDPVGGHGARV